MAVLSFGGQIGWVTYVYRSHLPELRRAYDRANLPFPSSYSFDAWSPYRAVPNDPPLLKSDKHRIVAAISKKTWIVLPLFLLSFFGLGMLSILLEVLHWRR